MKYDRRVVRQSIDDALERAAADPEFAWSERMPSEFYNPDFTKELARYIRNRVEYDLVRKARSEPVTNIPGSVKHVYTQDFIFDFPVSKPLTNCVGGQWVSVEIIDGKVYHYPVINGEVDYSKPMEE